MTSVKELTTYDPGKVTQTDRKGVSTGKNEPTMKGNLPVIQENNATKSI